MALSINLSQLWVKMTNLLPFVLRPFVPLLLFSVPLSVQLLAIERQNHQSVPINTHIVDKRIPLTTPIPIGSKIVHNMASLLQLIHRKNNNLRH